MRYDLLRAGAVLAILGTAAIPAYGQGVRVSGTVSQTFQLDNNYAFGGGNTEFRGFSRAEVTLSSETQNSRIGATTGINGSFTTGGGFNFSTPSLRFDASTRTQRTRYGLNLSYATGPIQFEEIQADLSIVDQTADQTRIFGRASIDTRIDNSRSFGLVASASSLDFDPVSADLVPSVDLNLDGTLTNQVNRTTSYDFTAGIGFFEGDGTAENTSISARGGVAMTRQMNADTTFSGNIGFSYVDTEATVGATRVDEFTLSAIFGASAVREFDDGSLSLGISQNVGPAATGGLVLNTGLTAGFVRQLNANEVLGISAALSRQAGIGPAGTDPEVLFSVTPSYTRQMTRDVEMEASYTLQRSDDGDLSHGIGVTFSHSFDRPVR